MILKAARAEVAPPQHKGHANVLVPLMQHN